MGLSAQLEAALMGWEKYAELTLGARQAGVEAVLKASKRFYGKNKDLLKRAAMAKKRMDEKAAAEIIRQIPDQVRKKYIPVGWREDAGVE